MGIDPFGGVVSHWLGFAWCAITIPLAAAWAQDMVRAWWRRRRGP